MESRPSRGRAYAPLIEIPPDDMARSPSAASNGHVLHSKPLSSIELQNLYRVQGHMPRIGFNSVPQDPVTVSHRLAFLDSELEKRVSKIGERMRTRTQQGAQFRECNFSWVKALKSYLPMEHLRLGVVTEIMPHIVFYMVYANFVAWYAYTRDWRVTWTLGKQDNIYYPATVLTFLLCFRASGCMDRYKEGMETLLEMERAVREVAFEVMTKLSIARDPQDEREAGQRNVCSNWTRKRYFKHEFCRLLRLLFACAARDLNDSALEECELRAEDVSRLQFAATEVEYAAMRVTHSAFGHAFRVYLVASWILKMVQEISREQLFDDDDAVRVTEENMLQFKEAWLKARQVAYSAMPSTVTHILWFLTTVMNLFMPWEWVTETQWNTWFPSLILSISFYGILHIANEMENPFGFDPDDIPMWEVAEQLHEEVCLIMQYSVLDEVAGENLYRTLMGDDMVIVTKDERRSGEAHSVDDVDPLVSES